MPMYLGQEVGQPFLDMICKVYREAYEAAHPTHEAAAEDDAALVLLLEGTVALGSPDACTIARYLANPDGLTQPPGQGAHGEPVPFAGVVGRFDDLTGFIEGLAE